MKAKRIWIAQAECDNRGSIVKISTKEPEGLYEYIKVIHSHMGGEVEELVKWVEHACIPIEGD